MTPVLSLIDRESGEVRSRVVADITEPTLQKAIAEHVDMANSTLHTDAGKQVSTGRSARRCRTMSGSTTAYECVRGDVTTNKAEGYFSQLKRSIDGTHHHVSIEHLQRYLNEFDFRYSTRTLSDSARMKHLFGQVAGKRLMYSVSLGGV